MTFNIGLYWRLFNRLLVIYVIVKCWPGDVWGIYTMKLEGTKHPWIWLKIVKISTYKNSTLRATEHVNVAAHLLGGQISERVFSCSGYFVAYTDAIIPPMDSPKRWKLLRPIARVNYVHSKEGEILRKSDRGTVTDGEWQGDSDRWTVTEWQW